jgi:signal transduction histidine kinase
MRIANPSIALDAPLEQSFVAAPQAEPSGAAMLEPKPIARPGIAPDELADLVRSFTEVTERLQSTHSVLHGQVAQLQGELANANEQLRRSRELAALGEMAAGIAHEIRNPLGSIALDVEMLRDDARRARTDAGSDAAAEQATICDRILRAVERLDHIVGDVLRFARDLRVQPTECEAGEIVDAALHACEAIIRRAGVSVERAVDADAVISADRHLLAQALTNLVRNAVEAMAESNAGERRLTMGARRSRRALADGRRAEHLILSIEDTGPGVPADLVERIFHPFFTTRSDGTGLGLAIVHRIIDAHGGSIAVRNRPDGGARFEIAIPMRSAQRVAEGRGRRRGDTAPTGAPLGRRSGGQTTHERAVGGPPHYGHRGDGLDEAVRRRIGPLAG